MDNLNFTSTKLGRKKAFWFLIITPSLLVLASVFTEINQDIVSNYLLFCSGIISLILGTKANDTYQKRVIKEKENYD